MFGSSQPNILQAAYNHRKKQRHQDWLVSVSFSATGTESIADASAVVHIAYEAEFSAPITATESIAEAPVVAESEFSAPNIEWQGLQLRGAYPSLPHLYCGQHEMFYVGEICQLCADHPNVHMRNGNVGYEYGGCVDGNHSGYQLDCEGCKQYAEECRKELAAGPLNVVLTGTFPELGGGRGLELGKEKLTQMVTKTVRGRVVKKISSKTTHLVTGLNPGQVKMSEAESFPFITTVNYAEFLDIIREKTRNPPVLLSKAQVAQKKADKSLLRAQSLDERDSAFQRDWEPLYTVYRYARWPLYQLTRLQPLLPTAGTQPQRLSPPVYRYAR